MNLITQEINNKAIEVANNALQKGFDWQAFLVLSTAQQNLKYLNDTEVIDYVENSGIDENVQLFLNKFIYLSKNKEIQTETENLEDLQSLLRFLKKIINELFFSSVSIKEKDLIKDFIESLQR